MNKQLNILILLFIFCQGYSQNVPDTSYQINGVVLDRDSLLPLFPVHVTLNGDPVNITDTQGRFAVGVKQGDTLRFSYVGYKDFQYILSESLVQKEYLAGIFMARDTITIREVVIIPRFVNLRNQMLSMKPENNPEMENAIRNLQISAYQGLVTISNEMDAEMNQDMVQQRYLQKAFDRGLVPTDQTLPITALIPLAYMMIKELRGNTSKPEIHITPLDIEKIKQLYLKQSSRIVPDTSGQR